MENTMGKDKNQAPEAPAEDTKSPPQDEFAGQGGSYSYDPVTQTRTRNPD